ncbi:MAG: translocation/assembly module TamB domain-containing protein [Alphaproteobacteria bacterium]
MMRRALRWLLYTLGLLLLILVGAVALLQTGPAKRLLAAKLSTLLSTPDSGFEIVGIDGWIPLDMRVGTLRLSDREGLWLQVEGITVDWSPSALLSGRIQVDEIGAERIELARTPEGEATPEPPSDEPFRLPELPASLPPITLERLAVPEIVLGAPVLGEAARFGLNGSIRANDRGDSVNARLELRRTDQPTAAITLDATAGLAPQTLDLALKADESGGMVAALAGRPDMGDVRLSLDGKGPLDSWSGRLHAEAGGLATADADLGLALVEQPRLTVNGSVKPAEGALPEDIADLIGEQLALDLDVVQTRAQALDLRKVEVTVDLGKLDAGGSVDFEAGDVVLESSLALPDLAPLSGLAQAALAGRASADLEVTGTLDAPEGKLDLRVDQPAFDGNSASAITSALRWTTAAALSSDRPAFDVTLQSHAEGLTVPGTVLPDPDISLNAALGIPLDGEIAIDHVTVETAGSSLTATGSIDPVSVDGVIDLTLDSPSLQRLAAPYGQPIDGKALIKAAVRLADQAKTIAVDLDAGLDQLSGLPPGAAELVGGKADLQAKIALDPSQRLTVEGLSLNGAHVGLDGDVSLALDRQTIAGKVNAALPDLTVLGALVPAGTAGAIDLAADIGGSLEAPTLDLRVDGRDVVLAGEPVMVLGITLSGQDLIASPTGDLAIDATARNLPASLTLGYRLTDGSTLDLDAIALKAPKTEIGGALAIDLDRTLIDGELKGRVAELGAFEPLLQQALGGGVDLSAVLAPDGPRQNAVVTVRGRNIDGDFGRVGTADVDATITDLTAQPALKAKASITGFEQGDTKIDALTLNASGNDSAVDFELGLAGEVVETLELKAKGSARFADGIALGIESLNGAFAGEPLRLAAPLAFQQAGNDIWLTDLDLRLGEASLTGNVEIGENAVAGALDLRSLPLRWSEVFGGPAISGKAKADIDLSGKPSNPKLVASLKAEGLLAENIAAGDVPLDLTLNALLDRGRLAANLESSGLTRKPITASASLPAKLSLRPFAFDMPENGALDGKVNAELRLARVADLLALDDQTMQGTLFADIAIGGTLAEPKVSGPVKLEGGAYENGTTGTDIQDLILTATASSERIDITELSGKTGSKRGTIASSGWLQLDAEKDFPLSVALRLDDARLVNRDDVDGRVSGEIAMTGSLAEAAIKGDLTVNRAEIAIPEGGGPNLPEIEVTEVGGHIVNPPKEEQEQGAKKGKPFDPALDVSIALPNKIYVRGRGLESEWEGDLQISGRASEPIITGSLRIKKGYFDFLDKRFELSLGEITFSGDTPPNPIIALEAYAEDNDFKAIIKVNGPADDPQLVLSSEPILPEDEILARLLFNRQLSQIGPVEAGKLALALNRLRGGSGFDAFGEIRNILKIDTLDVVSDEEGDSRVKAGKYLNDDVYVEVEKGAGDASGRARVEIELLPNIALEAETSENADSGVGIKWKLDY